MTLSPRRTTSPVFGVAVLGVLIAAGCVSESDSTPSTTTTTSATAGPAEAEDVTGTDPDKQGIFEDHVLFGQSAAFSGPAQELGKNMRRGIEAAFAEANLNGGIGGRRLELVSLDDAYEPEAAVTNTQRLISEEGVFALIGAVGTPTSRSATPVAAAAGTPYVAPFTGAAFLRDPQWRNVVNLRASYNQETEEIVARLIADRGAERIAVMFQDDSFGRAGYRGVLEALGRRDMEPVAIGLYPRNTTAVKTALLDLQQGDPDAVVLVGAYEPVAALIAWARHLGKDWAFVTISFVGSNALAEELGPVGAGVFVTQVVPFPTDDSLPLVASYLQALAAYDSAATPGFVSLEGYLAGRMAIAGLQRCGSGLTRSCFLDSLLRGDEIDIDGFTLSYGTNDNQGSDDVFLTVIGDDGQYRPTATMEDAGR